MIAEFESHICECENEDEDCDCNIPELTIRAKWTIDGAKTLSEAAKMAQEFAEGLLEAEKEGWQLRDLIDDDYGFAYKDKS